MSIELYKGDLPDDLDLGNVVAIDSETMGLKPRRDKLCLVQLSSGDGNAHLVQLDRSTYNAPNLCKLLTDPNVTKLFHFGRFDIAVFQYYLKVGGHCFRKAKAYLLVHFVNYANHYRSFESPCDP